MSNCVNLCRIKTVFVLIMITYYYALESDIYRTIVSNSKASLIIDCISSVLYMYK